jgi:hypothetical protein
MEQPLSFGQRLCSATVATDARSGGLVPKMLCKKEDTKCHSLEAGQFIHFMMT